MEYKLVWLLYAYITEFDACLKPNRASFSKFYNDLYVSEFIGDGYKYENIHDTTYSKYVNDPWTIAHYIKLKINSII